MPAGISGELIFHPFPALLIDSNFKILGRNEHAETVLHRENAVFSSARGRLGLSDPSAQARLQAYVQQLQPGRASFRLHNAEGGPSHWLIAQPRPGGTTDTPTFLLSLRLRGNEDIFDIEHLKCALDLTMAEAELAIALASGSSVRDFASKTNRKVTTVRWHLSNILRKAECEDQADLTRTVLLMSL